MAKKPKASEILKRYRKAVGNKLDKSVETLKIAQLGIELEKAIHTLEMRSPESDESLIDMKTGIETDERRKGTKYLLQIKWRGYELSLWEDGVLVTERYLKVQKGR